MENTYYFSRIGNFYKWTEKAKQEQLNDIIIKTTEMYLNEHFNTGYPNVTELAELTDTNFNSWTTDKALKYLRFAFVLTETGTSPLMLKYMLKTPYDVLIANAEKDEVELLSLQLSFIKKAFCLLHDGEYQDYFYFISELVSPDIDIYKYQPAFQERWNALLPFNPRRQEWV